MVEDASAVADKARAVAAAKTEYVDAWCETCADVRQFEIEGPGSCKCVVCGRVELLVAGSPAKGGSSLDRPSPSLGVPSSRP